MPATLDELDAAAEVGLPAAFAVADLIRPDLHNGYYTLTFPCGSHRTLRLYTQQRGRLAGKRILGLLIGPDNTADYEDFAFLGPAGFQIWKRFANDRRAEYAAMLWKMLGGEIIDGHDCSESRRCLACNRKLTTPESLEEGIGPTCKRR
jgi:hypothetical protein